MSVLSGTITGAGPPSPPLGKYKTIYQDIDLTLPDGTKYAGKIGSKDGRYSAGMAIDVTWETKKDKNQNDYIMFHKINPEYQQGAQSQGLPPQQQRQQQQQAPRQQQAPQGPTDKDILIVRQCCVKAAAGYCSEENATPSDVINVSKMFEAYCLGRDVAEQGQPSQPAGPNPDYDPDYQPPEHDDIPF
jgi:hypothetical protein